MGIMIPASSVEHFGISWKALDSIARHGKQRALYLLGMAHVRCTGLAQRAGSVEWLIRFISQIHPVESICIQFYFKQTRFCSCLSRQQPFGCLHQKKPPKTNFPCPAAAVHTAPATQTKSWNKKSTLKRKAWHKINPHSSFQALG